MNESKDVTSFAVLFPLLLTACRSRLTWEQIRNELKVLLVLVSWLVSWYVLRRHCMRGDLVGAKD